MTAQVENPSFDRFVMLAGMRTGSNFLESNLNALDGVTCHGELFNPHFIGKKDCIEYLGITLAAREADPQSLLTSVMQQSSDLTGFRFFHDHDPRVLANCLDDRRCAKIILTRNPVESYVSLQIARTTGQWKLGDARRRKAAQVDFDPVEFEAHLHEAHAFQTELLHKLQITGQTAFYIDYDDVQDVAVLNGLAAWLGVTGRLEAPVQTVKKQNPEPLEGKVGNLAQIETSLSRLDRFNLSRIPNFEPRRGPGVPGFMAAEGAPLLYMPVRCGPQQEVARWLGSISRDGAPSGLIDGFSQKTLRQWIRRSVGLRSFTVLRHPVARAHAAFCERILSGACPEVRAVLIRGYKIDLPPLDSHLVSDPGADPEAYRVAFMQFLQFLKGNLNGQTSVRIDAGWASQSTIVQGFAQFNPPDFVLREDRLSEGLKFLAAEVGTDLPPESPSRTADTRLLDMTYDAELEAAVREVYHRDYLAFGFDDWRAPFAQ